MPRRFLALVSHSYVAAEVDKNLQLHYLTAFDKLMMVATLIVFGVNVWNGMYLRMWTAEGAMDNEDGVCPGVNEAGLPDWFTALPFISELR
eukprot:COSAG04_NODE_49_length_31209_cov_11.630248_20_plen_91_part_00